MRGKKSSKPSTTTTPTHTTTTHTTRKPMAQSSFRESLDEFLDSTIDPGGESLPIKIEVVPECETRGTISSITLRKFQNEDQEWRAIVEVMFSCTDPAIKEETGLDDPRARYTIFLDTVKGWDGEGNPPLDFGRNKNVGLGRLREGLGTNDGRKFKWSSFMHEEAWIRVAKPRTEMDAFSSVVAIGKDESDVKRAGKKKAA